MHPVEQEFLAVLRTLRESLENQLADIREVNMECGCACQGYRDERCAERGMCGRGSELEEKMTASPIRWEVASNFERGRWVRKQAVMAGIRTLSRKDLCDLFQLSPDELVAVLAGGDYPECEPSLTPNK